MVRGIAGFRSALTRFPHARGDGPIRLEIGVLLVGFSPRPWGWSVLDPDKPIPFFVFPTPVGMVRCRNSLKCTPPSFPHARGDGPEIVNLEK